MTQADGMKMHIDFSSTNCNKTHKIICTNVCKQQLNLRLKHRLLAERKKVIKFIHTVYTSDANYLLHIHAYEHTRAHTHVHMCTQVG